MSSQHVPSPFERPRPAAYSTSQPPGGMKTRSTGPPPLKRIADQRSHLRPPPAHNANGDSQYMPRVTRSSPVKPARDEEERGSDYQQTRPSDGLSTHSSEVGRGSKQAHYQPTSPIPSFRYAQTRVNEQAQTIGNVNNPDIQPSLRNAVPVAHGGPGRQWGHEESSPRSYQQSHTEASFTQRSENRDTHQPPQAAQRRVIRQHIPQFSSSRTASYDKPDEKKDSLQSGSFESSQPKRKKKVAVRSSPYGPGPLPVQTPVSRDSNEHAEGIVSKKPAPAPAVNTIHLVSSDEEEVVPKKIRSKESGGSKRREEETESRAGVRLPVRSDAQSTRGRRDGERFRDKEPSISPERPRKHREEPRRNSVVHEREAEKEISESGYEDVSNAAVLVRKERKRRPKPGREETQGEEEREEERKKAVVEERKRQYADMDRHLEEEKERAVVPVPKPEKRRRPKKNEAPVLPLEYGGREGEEGEGGEGAVALRSMYLHDENLEFRYPHGSYATASANRSVCEALVDFL